MTVMMPDLQPTGRTGREYPALDEQAMPADRTICPRCLSLEPDRFSCHVCHNKPVCPACRNGRVVSVSESRFPEYRVCPTCCDPLTDANGRPERSDTGVPLWLLHLWRQRDAVAAYQQRRRLEYDDVPF